MLEPLRLAIAEVFDSNPARLCLKQIALRMGKAWQTLYSWRSTGEDYRSPTVEGLVQLTLISEDTRPLDAICRLAGGVFVPLPGRRTVNDALLETIKETAEAVTTTAAALKDKKLTERERARARREAREAVAALMALIAALESSRCNKDPE